ncbi:MAG: DNA mismatch repair endonuclease MutL [Blautia sp.]|nr:DNA mismatch repair endonuclease MutL [Blautia sp.]
MQKIALLDQNTIDKIAAGEVVERPSSVVKELVENAIDAGATAVTVEITDGGKKLIRITDNGSGMEADQVRLSFLRHATSKITKLEDLETISSLGFRGEALSSIAAVAQVELITKTHNAICGVRYQIEGGKETRMEEMGAPEGSTFLIRNLFFNTPARSKFLRTDTTEANYINALMEQLAMSHPEISFKYIQNQQVKLHTSGNYNTRDVIYSIYGRDITKSLLDIHFKNDFMEMEGFVGKPEISRGNRSFENYYINGRYVKDRIITKAIEDAYKGFLMQHKFPFVSIHIQMEGNDLDVNVHPQKMEVRFARSAEVYDAVYQTVRNALTRRELIPEVSITSEKPLPKTTDKLTRASVPEPFEVKRRQEINREEPVLTSRENKLFQGTLSKVSAPVGQVKESAASYGRPETIGNEHQKKLPDIALTPVEKEPGSTKKTEIKSEDVKQIDFFEEKLLTPEARSRHQIIGQIFDTYWLVQFEDKLYIIDQHAAHEKVFYERFTDRFQKQKIESQYISPPMIVTLTLREETILKANSDLFRKAGFEIEPFGGKEYCISAVPSNLYGLEEEGLFLEMLDQLAEHSEKDALEIFASRIASMACKAAVKGNQKMSYQEADHLIGELLKLDNPYHCPHGRPTIISMSRTELEKKFKRIL